MRTPGMDFKIDTDDYELIEQNEVAEQLAVERAVELDRIRQWIRPTDFDGPSSEYKRHLCSQAPSTGEWIRGTKQFKQWQASSDHGAIWIKAVPGAGKSVVAASMVDSLTRGEDALVLYFFFRQIIEKNRTGRSLTFDWMSQLLPHSAVLQLALWEYVEQKITRESVATDRLWNHLLMALRAQSRVYCVIDAMDEMSFDDVFLSKLDLLSTDMPASVKLLMTSRPKQYLQRALRNPQVIHVSLEEELVKRDIATFVEHRVGKLKRAGVAAEACSLLVDTICQRSEGLFLYARLILDQVFERMTSDPQSKENLPAIALGLPVGLEEMYNQLLLEQSAKTGIGEHVQKAILVLLTHSRRPLRLIEVAKALETESAMSSLKDSKDIVRQACGPLLEVMEDETVQVIHHSFTEFLLNINRLSRQETTTYQFPPIEPSVAHVSMFVTCLDYLQGDCFAVHSLEFICDSEKINIAYPFLDYASQYWHTHAKEASNPPFSASISKLLDENCLADAQWFRGWLAYAYSNLRTGLGWNKVSPLHVAANFGLTDWAQHLLEREADPNALNHEEESSLYQAACKGEHGIVELLLQYGADPTLFSKNGGSPLHAAARRNHASIVRLLLEKGVSPTMCQLPRPCGISPSSVGETPVQYASMFGNLETILEMIPYLTAQDLEKPLGWAAERGHQDVVSALLQRSCVSADASSDFTGFNKDWYALPALQIAVHNRHIGCVRTLLEHGADPSLCGPDIRDITTDNRKPHSIKGLTALHLLAQKMTQSEEGPQTVDEHLLQLLIDSGANIEARDGHGKTPISIALDVCLGYHHRPTLDLFIGAGADIFTTDAMGRTLLFKACERVYDEELITKLLDLGIDVQQATNEGSTPLHALCRMGCNRAKNLVPIQVASMLIERGADVNARDHRGNNALHAAMEADYCFVHVLVQLLLEKGADVHTRNESGQTCLHTTRIASYSTDARTIAIAMVLNAGSDLELQDRKGYTALLRASAENAPRLVKTLINFGAVVHAKTYDGKSCLHLACNRQCSFPLLELLIEKGADLHSVDNNGNSLLHQLAVFFSGITNHVKLLDLLLENGVNANLLNLKRQNMLHTLGQSRPLERWPVNTNDLGRKEDLVSMLFQRGHKLDLDAADIDGHSPLHFASAMSESQAYSFIQAGANVNATSHHMRTPLHCAARARQSNVICMLLVLHQENRLQLDVNIVDEHGNTPLHDACRSGRPESCQMLIDAGAKVDDTLWKACAGFSKEQERWASFANREATFDSAIDDPWIPIRPLQKVPYKQTCRWYYNSNHCMMKTAGSGRVARILLENGVNPEGLLRHARKYQDEDLLALSYDKGSLLRSGKLTIKEMQCVHTVDAIDQMLGSLLAARPDFHVCNDSLECEDFHSMSDLMFDAWVKRGIDLANANTHIMLTRIAELGLVERMRILLPHVEKLDNKSFSNSVSDNTQAPKQSRLLDSLLFQACQRPESNLEMMKILIKAGASVNANEYTTEEDHRDASARRILHRLAEGFHFWHGEAIKLLVQHGADVNATWKLGSERIYTPLKISLGMWNSTTVQGLFGHRMLEVLLQSGANPNLVDADGKVPLNYAGSDLCAIKLLVKHGASLAMGRFSVLVPVIEEGAVDAMKYLLEFGADCNKPDVSVDDVYQIRRHQLLGKSNEKYPLLVAAFPWHNGRRGWDTPCQMVSMLLTKGADLYTFIDTENTLLHTIFERGSQKVMSLVLQQEDLRIDSKDGRGRNVFLAACDNRFEYEYPSFDHQQEELEQLRRAYKHPCFLLANSPLHGPKIDYTDMDVNREHLIFHLLPAWDKNMKDRFLTIPSVKNLINQKNAMGYSPLHRALEIQKLDACFDLLSFGSPDLTEPDPNGKTVLHHLTRYIHLEQRAAARELCELYLAKGGSIEIRNNKGLTAFLDCASADNVDFFSAHGADVFARATDDKTILHLIASRTPLLMYPYDIHKDTGVRDFRAFMQLGLDPLAEDSEGRSSLDIAAATGNRGILKLFERKKQT